MFLSTVMTPVYVLFVQGLHFLLAFATLTPGTLFCLVPSNVSFKLNKIKFSEGV